MRTVTGLIAAPLAGALASSLFYAVLHTQLAPAFEIGSFAAGVFASVIIVMVFALFYGVPYALFVGWPVHLFLLRVGFTGVFVYGCFAASFTVAFARVFIAPSFGFEPGGPNDLLELIGLAIIAGGVGGVSFWLIRRPDRDAVSVSPKP